MMRAHLYFYALLWLLTGRCEPCSIVGGREEARMAGWCTSRPHLGRMKARHLEEATYRMLNHFELECSVGTTWCMQSRVGSTATKITWR